MTNFQEEIEHEKASEETVKQEPDKLKKEVVKFQSIINEKDAEIVQLNKKIERLQEDISEVGLVEKTDAELTKLRRQQREYETKLQDQEEELEEQVGKIHQLEQTKARLEMSITREKQNYQRDIDAKDEEIERAKQDCTRKMRTLEEQLDDEIKKKEEITKAKRVLEQKVFDLEASVDSNENKATERKLKKELKRIKALYNDAKNDVELQPQKPDQSELKSLRSQLEDAEFGKQMALKAKSQVEAEIQGYQTQIDSMSQAKDAGDSRYMALQREHADMQGRMDELEEEIEEILQNNKQLVSQLAESKNVIIDIKESNRAIEDEKIHLIEKVNVLTKQLESAEENKVEKTEVERMEIKVEELEVKLENDSASRIKQDHLIHRLRSQLARIQEELVNVQDEQNCRGNNTSKYERMYKDARNELETSRNQEAIFKRKKEEAENEVQNLEDELSRKKSENLSQTKRIRELQAALEAKECDSDDDSLSLLGESDASDDTLMSSLRRVSSNARMRRSFTKRSNTFDVYGSNLSSSSLRSSLRRTSNDTSSIMPNNGYISRDLSRDDALSTNYFTAKTYSRTSSKMASRQDSFE